MFYKIVFPDGIDNDIGLSIQDKNGPRIGYIFKNTFIWKLSRIPNRKWEVVEICKDPPTVWVEEIKECLP